MRSPLIGLALAASVSLAASGPPQAAAQPIQLLPPTDVTGARASPIVAAPGAATSFGATRVSPDRDARSFLFSARSAVVGQQTVQAEAALERAETRLLGGATPPVSPVVPVTPTADNQRSVQMIVTARSALAANDRPAALRAIDDALSATAVVARSQSRPPLALAAPISPPPPVTAPPAPTVTRALLAGHWTLDGADWKWVPPETVLRPAETAPEVAGQYVWRNLRYVWVPTHYLK